MTYRLPLRVGLLGPLELFDDRGDPVAIGGPMVRALLARMTLDAGMAIRVDSIIDDLWPAEPPAGASNALQSLVSRLRRALGEGVTRPIDIVALPGAYRLAVIREQVDAFVFEDHAVRGRDRMAAGDCTAAASEFRAGLALWRGDVFADLDFPFAAGARDRIGEARLRVSEDLIDCELQLGHGADVLELAEKLTAAHPLRERLHAQLIAALSAAGRQADALAAYERIRAQLADELGVDPSAVLANAHLAVLRGDAAAIAAPMQAAAASPALAAAALAAPAPAAPKLKSHLASFVGRDDDVARVGAALEESRLVTLLGPGGAGKTRLSLETAKALTAAFPDGVRMIELASVGDESTVHQAVAAGLRLSEFARPGDLSTASFDRITAALADSRMLILLDNCEHLVGAAAAFADELLSQCEHLRVLATSREPLGITGEVLYPVLPLALPESGTPIEELLSYSAVELFCERARAVRSDFTLSPANGDAVVEICRELDGMPLALELAAARVRSLSVAEIRERLRDRFALLSRGERTAPGRHQTLRAVIEWSWDLLTESEQILASRFGAFSGGATLADLEAICADEHLPAEQIFDVIEALVDKSFVNVVDGRFRMLETIRVFCVDMLEVSCERDDVRKAHMEHFIGIAVEAEPHLRTADQLTWLARLSADRDNLLLALRYAIDTGDAAQAVRGASALGWWWTLLGEHSEAAPLIDEVLDMSAEAEPGRSRSYLLAMAAVNSMASDRNEQAREYVAAADAINARLGDCDDSVAEKRPEVVRIVIAKAMLAAEDGNLEESERLLRDGIANAEDDWTLATMYLLRGMLRENVGDMSSMEADLQQALDLYAITGDRWGLAAANSSLASLRELEGDHVAAFKAYEQALEFNTLLGVVGDRAYVLVRMAMHKARAGDYDGARADLEMITVDGPYGEWAAIFMACAYGDLERRLGNLGKAREILEAARRDALAIGAEEQRAPGQMRATVLLGLAMVDLDSGNLATARSQVSEAVVEGFNCRDMPVVGNAVEGLAAVLLAEGDPQACTRLIAAAERLRGSANQGNHDVAELLRESMIRLGPDTFSDLYDAAVAQDRTAAEAYVRSQLQS